jgi:hypothetical protein
VTNNSRFEADGGGTVIVGKLPYFMVINPIGSTRNPFKKSGENTVFENRVW